MTNLSLAKASMDGLDNDDRLRVLGIVDQFRELGINEDISLPQLVVVGDQSSGKSSLLEGVTGLSFPIASELCTRFATQIVLRRSSHGEDLVKISILPGPTSMNNEEQKSKLGRFSRTIAGKGLSKEDFAKILDEAAICMGLPATSDHHFEELSKRFSDDVLKIELSGPAHPHLSVVDVPGLFHNPTKYQTQEDLDTIRGLLGGYITDKRTIILAVMDARNNLANQEVFRMARSADPQGKRTVGIVTKCDALQPGDEEMVLKIAQNSVERLHHGWFAVKNRSTQDIQNNVSIQQRHVNEKKFFLNSPWNQLPKNRVGIPALKEFLGQLLYDHIRGEFPVLVQEIRSHVLHCREEIDQLGPPRQSTLQQRQFLTRLAASYQQSVFDCLKGNYESQWDAEDARKLRMHLHLENDNFTTLMGRKGHTRPFKNVDDSPDEEYGFRAKNQDDIYRWIRQRYRESRGAELPGTVNPTVLESLFRQQAVQWRDIAHEHLRTIDKIVSEYNDRSWSGLVVDETVRQRIIERNLQPTQWARQEAEKQLNLLLADEMSGILQTTNHYFADNLAANREARVLQRFKKLGIQENNAMMSINLADIAKAAHLSNEEQAVYDLHDILKAYYKVAIKRFVDNVVLQAVERCYLGEAGPVKFISPQYIGELTDEMLADIAQESYATASVRTETSYRLERFENALAIAEAEQMRRKH